MYALIGKNKNFRGNNITMRIHYWTCSKFADFLRGTPKPSYASGAEWTKWRKAAKESHQFRYWLADAGLNNIQNTVMFIPDKLYGIKCYFRNRWVDHTHALVASKKYIKRGQWCDVGGRFLPALFESLVNFVEVELAQENFYSCKRSFWQKMNRRYNFWSRSPQNGLDHLHWAMALINDENDGFNKSDPQYGKPTFQAVSAKEIYDLYMWWTTIYPNRPDPYKISGWSEYCDKSHKETKERTNDDDSISWLDHTHESASLRKSGSKALALLQKIEKQYEDEETKMMIRLIKMRGHLWT